MSVSSSQWAHSSYCLSHIWLAGCVIMGGRRATIHSAKFRETRGWLHIPSAYFLRFMQASSGVALIRLARHMGSPCFHLNCKHIIEDHLQTQPRPRDLTLRGRSSHPTPRDPLQNRRRWSMDSTRSTVFHNYNDYYYLIYLRCECNTYSTTHIHMFLSDAKR